MFDTPLHTVSQIIGFCGMAGNFIAFQQTKRRNILLVQIISALLFILHYVLLGQYTGAALNFIGFCRSVVFINNGKKWARSRVWLYIFIALCLIAGVVTWSGPFSVLPPLAMILSTVANWMKSEKQIRFITFPSSPCWLIYNVSAGSVAGVITECVTMTSLLISIIRYDILHKGVKKNEN